MAQAQGSGSVNIDFHESPAPLAVHGHPVRSGLRIHPHQLGVGAGRAGDPPHGFPAHCYSCTISRWRQPLVFLHLHVHYPHPSTRPGTTSMLSASCRVLNALLPLSSAILLTPPLSSQPSALSTDRNGRKTLHIYKAYIKAPSSSCPHYICTHPANPRSPRRGRVSRPAAAGIPVSDPSRPPPPAAHQQVFTFPLVAGCLPHSSSDLASLGHLPPGGRF